MVSAGGVQPGNAPVAREFNAFLQAYAPWIGSVFESLSPKMARDRMRSCFQHFDRIHQRSISGSFFSQLPPDDTPSSCLRRKSSSLSRYGLISTSASEHLA